jgi:tetratricopeptide (TPR) repeat protein
MKGLGHVLQSYLPPLTILSFLLLTNLFTRSEIFRNALFPEQKLKISAVLTEDAEANIQPISSDTSTIKDADSGCCHDSLYLLARDSIVANRLIVAVELLKSIKPANACANSAIQTTLGFAFLRTKAYHDADSAFSTAISADSTNARAWSNRGFCRTRLNRFAAGRKDYQRALSIDPTLAGTHFNYGILLMRSKEYAAARTSFRTAIEWGADKSTAWYDIGLTYQSEDSADAALAAYRESIRYTPGRSAPRLRIAQIWLDHGRLDSAEAVLSEAAAIDPGNPDVGLRLARISANRGRHAQAITLLDAIDKIHPGLAEVAYERARSYGLSGDDRRALSIYEKIMAQDPSNPRVYYNIGVNLMDLGKPRDAIAAYAKALKVDPSYWKAAYNLGVYYLKMDKPIEAIPYFANVVQTIPDRPGPHYNLGIAYLKSGNTGEARKAFSHAVYLDSNHIESRYNLGMALMKDGQNDSAAGVFLGLTLRLGCHAKSLYNLGLIAKRETRFGIADSFFADAIACRNGTYPAAWYNRAICQRRTGRLADALTSVRHAVVNDSDNVFAKAILLQAELFDTLGMADSATRCLTLADSLNTNDPEALEDLANYYTRHHDAAHMRSVYSRILLANPQNVAVLLAAAELEETGTGSQDSAMAYYRRAIAVDDQDVAPIARYGRLLARIGRYDEAQRELQNAVALDPGAIDPRVQLTICFAAVKKQSDYDRELRKLRGLAAAQREQAFEIGKGLYRAGLHTDAAWYFEESVRLEPADPEVRYYLLLCQDKGAIPGFSAEQEWRRYCEDFPKEARGWYQLARIQLDTKMPAQARQSIEKALSIKEYRDSRLVLATVNLALGDSAAARMNAARYHELNPDDKKGERFYEALRKK